MVTIAQPSRPIALSTRSVAQPSLCISVSSLPGGVCTGGIIALPSLSIDLSTLFLLLSLVLPGLLYNGGLLPSLVFLLLRLVFLLRSLAFVLFGLVPRAAL